MKTDPAAYHDFYKAVCEDELVFLFGTGITGALTGKPYSWKRWIVDGIKRLADRDVAELLAEELEKDGSAAGMISVVGKVLAAAKQDGSYTDWMQDSFESGEFTNAHLGMTLRKLVLSQVVFATTNYDLLLEKASGLDALSYDDTDITFPMLDSHRSTHVLHIHGIYDSVQGVCRRAPGAYRPNPIWG